MCRENWSKSGTERVRIICSPARMWYPVSPSFRRGDLVKKREKRVVTKNRSATEGIKFCLRRGLISIIAGSDGAWPWWIV